MKDQTDNVGESQAEEPINWGFLFSFYKYLLLTRLYYLISSLTKHYPLSRWFIAYNFHYRYREQNIVQDLLYEKSYTSAVITEINNFSIDQYFVTVVINITTSYHSHSGILLRQLKKEVGRHNLYIRKLARKQYKINFVRSALQEEMLMHRKILPF